MVPGPSARGRATPGRTGASEPTSRLNVDRVTDRSETRAVSTRARTEPQPPPKRPGRATQADGKKPKRGPQPELMPMHWIAIATITVAVLGAVLGVLSGRLSEHAAHLGVVESGTADSAESVARIEQLIKTTGARVSRIEAKIETLLQLHGQSPPH